MLLRSSINIMMAAGRLQPATPANPFDIFAKDDPAAPLRHLNADCWSKCNKQNGPCAWCGTKGMCCRRGWEWRVNGGFASDRELTRCRSGMDGSGVERARASSVFPRR